MALKLLLIGLIVCIAAIQPAAAEPMVPSPPTILILNSYNKGMLWTDEQTDGMIVALRDSGIDPVLFVEYIDWKNHPTPENLRLTYDLLKAKYAKKKIDIVMATDDMAVSFALQHRQELFSGAPLVFSGIYPAAAEKLTADEVNVTGVYELPDMEGTIRLMVSLNPDLNNIYLLFDNTESGAVTWVPVEKAAPRIKQGLSVIPLNYLSREEIAAMLQTLPDDAAVLVTSYSRDIAGNVMELERYVKFFAENSRVPVYILYDFETGYGAVGGSVLSGKRQGREAASLALKILGGERAANMLPVNPKDSVTVIDYRQLVKHNLPVDKVPDGSTFINRPQSFFDQHRQVIGTAVTIIVVMAVYIILLISSIRQRRVAESNLKKSNEELGSLYEEILASQEELQAQYESLETAKQALQESEERYKLSLAGANDGLWDWDFVTNEYLSERCTELVGLDRPKVSGLDGFLAKAVPVGERRKVLAALRNHLQGKTPHFSYEHRINTQRGVKWIMTRGKALLGEGGKPVRMAGSITDISERKAKDDLVAHMAYHDSLTGIANRAALNRELATVLTSGPADERRGAMLFIDLDNFKGINDTFGHSYGDRLLIVVSQLLQRVDDGRHFVARVGGDEFIVLLEGVASRSQVADYADKLLAIFDSPLSVDGKNFYVTVSIGTTLYPDDGMTGEELFKNADMAMYKAKDLGKNRYVFFDRTMDESVRQKMMIERELREAISNGELRLWYQPFVEAATGRVCGLEALIRWQRGSRLVMPGDFIKVAEETGLIVPIGDWVFRSACAFVAGLHRQGHGHLVVSINLSVVQLIRGDFVQWVRDTIEETGIEPQDIAFEITESVLMDTFEANIDKLAEVRRMGIKIYLDDFGTGYSSLKYLRQLPVDIIKIDKSFVDDLNAAAGEREIIGSIINLAHRAQQKVVAEGVETQYQLEKLIKFKCDFVQGYHFSKPVAEKDVPALLARLG